MAASMSSAMKINPCPFCGSHNAQLMHRLAYFVECGTCFAEGPWKRRHHSGKDHGDEATEVSAVSAWNNRATHS